MRNIVVEQLTRKPIESCEVEICEHKGIGHPDTICDGVCEAASTALSKAYIKDFGRILHHNVDKGLLVAGSSKPCFNGGTIVKQIKIIIAGRATAAVEDKKIDVNKIVIDAANSWLKENIGGSSFKVETELMEGAGNLKEVFTRAGKTPLANDTSFGVGFAPYSCLEKTVLEIAALLRDKGFLQSFPAVGDDFKIMGLRIGRNISITLAVAFIGRHIKDVHYYFETKERLKNRIAESVSEKIELAINTLDNPNAAKEDDIYLTVSGLSAEMGDDGQVGRGNRVNGLITPNREMSLEAAAGKNPISHVGKIYNILAGRIAFDIHKSIKEVDEVHVKLLSAIGMPIDQPQVASVEVFCKNGLTEETKEKIRKITDSWLANIARITEMVINREVRVY